METEITHERMTNAEFIEAWRAFAEQLYRIGKNSGFYDTPAFDKAFNHEQKLLLMVSEIVEGMEGLRGAPWPGIADESGYIVEIKNGRRWLPLGDNGDITKFKTAEDAQAKADALSKLEVVSA